MVTLRVERVEVQFFQVYLNGLNVVLVNPYEDNATLLNKLG